MKTRSIRHSRRHNDGSSEAVRRFKAHVAAAKSRTQFLYGYGTASFARELCIALSDLHDAGIEPRRGVELVAEFFRSDKTLFNRCDDSDGNLGQVFKFDARDLFVHYASACDDKEWIANLILQLQSDDDYGVRDCLFDVASLFLPEAVMRDLVEQLWTLARGQRTGYRQRGWLYLIESLARQLHDPKLFEQASRATSREIYPTQCIDIARVYFESGDAPTALSWLSRVLNNDFVASERDELLLAVYRKLEDTKAAANVAWRIFRRSRHERTFEQLLEVIGSKDRQRLLDKEVDVILRTKGLSYADAEFMIWCGKIDETERYLLARAEQLDGDEYYWILPLAETMEREERYLAATVLYRALLESILARALSKYYGHGVRYLRKLDALAPNVTHWRTFTPHKTYFLEILDKHQRKSSFWERYERKGGKKQTKEERQTDDLS